MARDEARSAAFLATLSAGALLAHQVAANATRDALFLSSFDVTDLPRMIVVAAIVSVAVVLSTSRLLVRFSPAKFVPVAFVISASALVVEWLLLPRWPSAAAIIFYLHTIAFGSVLTSGFWSMVNERFDPRSAKRLIGRIASGGTLGAVVGGICAERIGAKLGLDSMFLFLAALHVFCAFSVRGIVDPKPRRQPAVPEKAASGVTVLADSGYLKRIALLVLLVTVSASLLDYVLKSYAATAYPTGASLVRFFATFYAALGLVSFIVQTAASRAALERLGLGITASILPFGVIGGALIALFFPGIATAGLARGIDRVARTSLYRSAYELLYTPISPAKKRATKSIIDVLCDRLGDAVGGALIAVVLAVVAVGAERVLLAIAIVLSALGAYVAIQLQRGYVEALEQSLISLGADMSLPTAGPATAALARVVQRTEFLIFDRTQGTFAPSEPEALLAGVGLSLELGQSRIGALARTLAPPPDRAQVRRAALASRDAKRVRDALMEGPLTEDLTPTVIPLLAWDEVFRVAMDTLVRTVDRDVGVLAGALADQSEDFAVRRRLPRVLANASSDRAAAVLIDALGDARFEVRFQAGRALAKLVDRHEFELDQEALTDAAKREANLGQDVWQNQRLIDADDDERDIAARLLADRGSRSMEHVFRLLSLVLEKTALKTAFQGLQTPDATLRGTALEYLDSVLPEDLKASLWPFLDADAAWEPSDIRDKNEVVEALMKSRPSILEHIDDL